MTTTTRKATVTMDRRQLSAILARIVDTAPNNSPKPILQCVRISVNGQVTFTANDLDRYHVETCSPEASGEIDVMVNAKQLRKAVTSSKAKQLTLELTDDSVKIGGQSIPVRHNVDDFPGCETPKQQAKRHIPAETLIRLLERTLFACDIESFRFALGGVLVEMDLEDKCGGDTDLDYLRLVGTDGRRLATDYTGTHRGTLVSVVWPATACKAAIKALKKAHYCELAVCEDKITLVVFLKDETTANYIMRAMEGRFPKWRDVIPQDFESVCCFDADGLADVLTSALAATSDESRGADICCHSDTLTVSTSSQDNGSYSGDLPVVSSSGNPLDIALDCRFLLDWCKACKGYVLELSAFDVALETRDKKQSDGPVRIQCDSADYVIMPLRRDKPKCTPCKTKQT